MCNSAHLTIMVFLLANMSALYSERDLCNGVICAQDERCDHNTGVCRQFRLPYGVLNPCENRNCIPPTQCDLNTGQCVIFRKPYGLYLF
ncbi:hypothetical protein AB6A40_004167 [Gnathostoma spinigerum]|uniref:Uncharacterized protein n=1 Tax=Gnathostoma spinigerum TaxID=75299 RepID=A0ABD6EKG5_9BILA